MSNENPISDMVSVNELKFVRHYDFNDVVGELLMLSETLGLPRAQEDAFKTLVKRVIWKKWGELLPVQEDVEEYWTKKYHSNEYRG